MFQDGMIIIRFEGKIFNYLNVITYVQQLNSVLEQVQNASGKVPVQMRSNVEIFYKKYQFTFSKTAKNICKHVLTVL